MTTIEQKQKIFNIKHSNNPSKRDELKGHYKPGYYESKYDKRGSDQADKEHLRSHLNDVFEYGPEFRHRTQVPTDEDGRKLIESQGDQMLLDSGDADLVWTSDHDLDPASYYHGLSESDAPSTDDVDHNVSPEEVGVKGSRRIREELARAATAEDIAPEEVEDLGDLSHPDRYITRNPR